MLRCITNYAVLVFFFFKSVLYQDHESRINGISLILIVGNFYIGRLLCRLNGMNFPLSE